jgi:hypothetical protein
MLGQRDHGDGPVLPSSTRAYAEPFAEPGLRLRGSRYASAKNVSRRVCFFFKACFALATLR